MVGIVSVPKIECDGKTYSIVQIEAAFTKYLKGDPKNRCEAQQLQAAMAEAKRNFTQSHGKFLKNINHILSYFMSSEGTSSEVRKNSIHACSDAIQGINSKEMLIDCAQKSVRFLKSCGALSICLACFAAGVMWGRRQDGGLQ